MKTLKLMVLAALFPGFSLALFSQDFKANPRFSFYTTENQAEVLVFIGDARRGQQVNLKIKIDINPVYQVDTTLSGPLLRVWVPLQYVKDGEHTLSAHLTRSGSAMEAQSTLTKLQPKSNAVKIDRLTGKLIINELDWLPFGYYCYSPVQSSQIDDEVVKGFNVMSPYQKLEPGTLREREAYMDRCARLGMKVHYQLISLAGGGGVGSDLSPLSGEKKMKRLKEEVEHFRNHPALLAWYLSDEPTGNGVSPDSLKRMYQFIHDLDPYHPVTIVFDAPKRAREYADAMDIVMADPYPIPNAGVDKVGNTTSLLRTTFAYEKPVWIVPQAFGGGEWWSREPSPQEIRAMTYLALVRGASGIQYFIRQGPNGFPKSTVTWGECAKMAAEVAEINPYLLNGTPIPAMMKVKKNVWMNAWKYHDETLIMAVNSKNEPQWIKLEIPNLSDNDDIEVLFENRKLKATGNEIIDWIGPYGTQVYRIDVAPEVEKEPNLISDPDFESTLNYGVPAGCYARIGSDHGATAFLDTRTTVSGYHSLRLTTPEQQKGMGLSFFPVNVQSGHAYRFSLYAKADTTSWFPGKKPTFWQKILGKKLVDSRNFRVKIGDLVDQSYTPTADWTPYSFYFGIPENSTLPSRINPYLELQGQGIAWFDNLVLTEDPVIRYAFDQKDKRAEIILSTGTPNGSLRYNLEGRTPTLTDPEYTDPIGINKSVSVAVGVFQGNTLLSWVAKTCHTHLAIGHAPVYTKKYSSGYTAGGAYGLVDGKFGSKNYQDGNWQGFSGQDLTAVIDLDSVQPIRKVTLGGLQDISAWIFMPLKVEVEGSTDGVNYTAVGSVDNTVDEHEKGGIRKDFIVEFPSENFRYIRVKATNRKACPEWHNGKGRAAYIFVDEIAVE